MGACWSTLKKWKDEAEEASSSSAGAGRLASAPPPPHPSAPAINGQMDHLSQENSLAHLIRHPRLQPFHPLGAMLAVALQACGGWELRVALLWRCLCRRSDSPVPGRCQGA